MVKKVISKIQLAISIRLFFMLICFTFVPTLSAQTENCIIAVIDGLRYSESFGDSTHKYIPAMWDSLAPQGTLYTNYYNNGWTKTNSGHASIMAGSWQYLANDGTERPNLPTIFEYYIKQNGDSSGNHRVILGKDKLDILSHSEHPEYGSDYAALVKTSSSQYSDSVAYSNTLDVLKDHHPRIAIINFPKTDRTAHSGIWNDYVEAIKSADGLMLDLWNFLQSDSIYKNKTTLIITNDHGRHLDGIENGFSGHGDDCEGCRHIMLLILGPNSEAGVIDTSFYEQIDIAPTIGHLLEFDLPYANGKVISSVYTAFADHSTYLIPQSHVIIKNYPNPFNPVTTIMFYLPVSTRGQINIFTADGRKVETLYSGIFKPGSSHIQWDASSYSSGFYIIQLTSGMGTHTKKCLYLK